MDWELITRLMNCFPNSFINQNGEFIAYPQSNLYFILKDCKNELDVKCKVIEWFSRAASKSYPESSKREQREQAFILSGINQFLGTEFKREDVETIYIYLGNAIHHDLTMRFVESGYDMGILEESEDLLWGK